MSVSKYLDHLVLKAKLNSVPAAPAPTITTLGIVPEALSSYSFFSILGRRSLIGLVVKACSQTPLTKLVSLVLEPILTANMSYSRIY